MNGIKVFSKNKKELVNLGQTTRICSQNISGIEKCAKLITKNRQRESAEETEQPDQECMTTPRGKEKCTYLRILGVDIIKQSKRKETIRKE